MGSLFEDHPKSGMRSGQKHFSQSHGQVSVIAVVMERFNQSVLFLSNGLGNKFSEEKMMVTQIQTLLDLKSLKQIIMTVLLQLLHSRLSENFLMQIKGLMNIS